MADELYKLVADLGEVPQATEKFLRKAIVVSARNVKDQISSEYSGARQLPAAAGSISYDLEDDGLSADVGPELGGQGSLVGMVDNGTVNSPGKKRIPKALADETPGLERGISIAIADGLKAAGL